MSDTLLLTASSTRSFLEESKVKRRPSALSFIVNASILNQPYSHAPSRRRRSPLLPESISSFDGLLHGSRRCTRSLAQASRVSPLLSQSAVRLVPPTSGSRHCTLSLSVFLCHRRTTRTEFELYEHVYELVNQNLNSISVYMNLFMRLFKISKLIGCKLFDLWIDTICHGNDQMVRHKLLGVDIVPVLVGPVSYLLLSKPAKDVDKTFNLLSLLDKILPVYKKGDYFRYLAEFKSSEDCMEVKDQSLKAYEAATTAIYPINISHFLINDTFYTRDVSNNNIYGEIPYGLPLNPTNLDLSYNQFIGDLLSSFGTLRGLSRLFLQHNEFTGSVIFLADLQLSDLRFGGNMFDRGDTVLLWCSWCDHGSMKAEKANSEGSGPSLIIGSVFAVEPSRAREAHTFHELELELEIEARGESRASSSSIFHELELESGSTRLVYIRTYTSLD
ncbi:hypothetical protein LXL04_000862 [Taraxacum kok-saghyz]